MINKYPGTCECGERVPVGAGSAVRGNDGRWRVLCAACAAEGSGAVTVAPAAVSAPTATENAPYTLLSGHAASAYQAAVFDHFKYGKGSRLVIAVAGAGKTTTIKNAVQHLPDWMHVQMLAFNTEATDQLKAAIDELREKTGREFKHVRANSFHSLGMGAVRKYLNLPEAQIKVDSGKCRKLLQERLVGPEGEETLRVYGTFATRLVAFAKGEGIGALVADTEDRWFDLVDHHGLYLDRTDAEPRLGVELARRLLGWSNEAARAGWLDFDDQLYLVCLWKLRLWQNHVVVCDECFVPETPILVGMKGEQRTIKDLYENGFNDPIVTWSPDEGTHLSKIAGVKRVPVSRPMVRIRTRRLSGSRNHPGFHFAKSAKTRTLVCTADHRIWTREGWLPASELIPGTIVKHETIAPVVRSYQSRYAHTETGRKSLSDKADPKRFGNIFIPNKFVNRGGNGRGPTHHERLMVERLGDGWVTHHIVRTGAKKINFNHGGGYHGKGNTYSSSNGLPFHFKLDIANPERMIAIEIDGKSHNNESVKENDFRKEEWLRSNGWTVIRLSNDEVLSLTDDEILERLPACPADAAVISVERWINRKHDYVYDLTVEGTNCYFAHGMLVHNCQDTNPVRRAILHLALKDGGRLYAVGDPNQAIYGFTGASADAMDLIRREFNAATLPLTVSYRCARAIVERAQTWVPSIEPADGAPEGLVEDEVPLADALTRLGPTDAILCRQTAPLVSVAYGLIARGRACRILGKEIGDGLVNLIEQQKARGLDRLLDKLEAWRDREMAKFIAKGEETRAEAVADRADCVRVIAEALPETQRTVPALVAKIQSMFVDPARGEKQRVLTLATCHKSKGKEWPTVTILRPDLMPSRAARQQWQIDQEMNLSYVAATRAKGHLIYCATEDMTIDKPEGK